MATISTPSFTTFTNLGPLTTQASFPADCLASLYDFNTPGLGLPWTYGTQGCALSTCCPSGHFYTEGWAWMTSYYSPGVCPSQYQQCRPPASPTALSSSSGETIAFCCPTNYECPDASGISWRACNSLLSTPTIAVVLDNIFDQRTISTEAFTIPSTMVNMFQIAYPIQVRWKAQDFASGPDPTTIPAANEGQTSRIGSTTTTTAIATTSSSTRNQVTSGYNLSKGAIVGIAIGCFILALLAAIGSAAIARKRRRTFGQNGSNTDSYYLKPELDSHVKPHPPELSPEPRNPEHHDGIHEAPSSNMKGPMELPGSVQPYELMT